MYWTEILIWYKQINLHRRFVNKPKQIYQVLTPHNSLLNKCWSETLSCCSSIFSTEYLVEPSGVVCHFCWRDYCHVQHIMFKIHMLNIFRTDFALGISVIMAAEETCYDQLTQWCMSKLLWLNATASVLMVTVDTPVLPWLQLFQPVSPWLWLLQSWYSFPNY